MRNKSSTGVFMFAYNLARSARLLEMPWFQSVFLFTYFLYKRWYEDPFWALTQRNPELFGNGDVLDIGANVGYTAYVFVHILKSPAKVYAFEPDRASFGTLEETVRRKKLSGKVEVFNMAVGSADGSVSFWHNEEHSADHRVVTEQFQSSHPSSGKITTVAVTSVDNFVAARSISNISFIKIDVQGYELAVCEGMRQTLQRFPELCVALEYDPEGIRELGFDPEKLLEFFRSAGYNLYVLSRAAITSAADNRSIDQLAEKAGYVDLLCSRKTLS
ncbi:MAG: FkbM family methyltransferase [Candidatus Acidiferrum sp.]